MPIYEFICEDCNYKEDLIKKISEPTTISCPKCNGQNFVKQVSAPNFKLKGSGWYETDFKSGKKKNVIGDESSRSNSSKGASNSKNADSKANGSGSDTSASSSSQ